MARYTGPRSKIARKFGEPIFGPDKNLDRKNFPPGQHGLTKKRKKTSEYGVQLREKQKVKYTYGLLERQFRNFFEKASSASGVTGLLLLQMLESRLDNVVYRLGFAPSRRAARSFVRHGHVKLNGKKADIPSMVLKEGDKISVRNKPGSIEYAKQSVEEVEARVELVPWLTLDKENVAGEILHIPSRDEIAPIVNEQLIVELYSK